MEDRINNATGPMAETLALVVRVANDARFVTATMATHGFGERDQKSFNLLFV